MSTKVPVRLHDRLDKSYILYAEDGQALSSFLTQNYIPKDAVLAKVDGKIINDNYYKISLDDKLSLYMVRAYQLPEYCKVLELWNNKALPQENESIYTKKCLWFNNNGIADLKYSDFDSNNFTQWLDDNFVNGILAKNLIEENDTILLALSGGRDSLALLYLLQRNRERLPNFNLVGLTVADSAADKVDIIVAKEAMANLGVDDYTILDNEYLNKTMNYKNSFDQAINKALSVGGRGRSIAMWHCVMRANVERFARERRIQKIAFGYQHEDLLASVLRCYTIGDIFGQSTSKKQWGEFTLISPLWTITKKELTIYLEIVAPQSHSKQGSPTDFYRGDHNRDITYFIADLLSSVHPGFGYLMFNGLEEMHKNFSIKEPDYLRCNNCGITYNNVLLQGQEINTVFCDHCIFLKEVDELNLLQCIEPV